MDSLRSEGRLFSSVEQSLLRPAGKESQAVSTKVRDLGVRTHNAFVGWLAKIIPGAEKKILRCDLGDGTFRYVNANSLRAFIKAHIEDVPDSVLTPERLKSFVEGAFNPTQERVSSESMRGEAHKEEGPVPSLFAQRLQAQFRQIGHEGMRAVKVPLLMKEYLQSLIDTPEKRLAVLNRMKTELFPLLLEKAEEPAESGAEELAPDIEQQVESLGKKFLTGQLTSEELQQAKRHLESLQSFAGEWRRTTHPSLGREGVDDSIRLLEKSTQALADKRDALIKQVRNDHISALEEAVNKKSEVHGKRELLQRNFEQGLKDLISKIKRNSTPSEAEQSALPRLQALLHPQNGSIRPGFENEAKTIFDSLSASIELRIADDVNKLRVCLGEIGTTQEEELRCSAQVERCSVVLQSDGIDPSELRGLMEDASKSKVALRAAQEARDEAIFKTFGRQAKKIGEKSYAGGARAPDDDGFRSFREDLLTLVRTKLRSEEQGHVDELAESVLLGACIDAYPHLKHPKEMMDTLVSPCMLGGESVLVPSMIQGTESLPLEVRESEGGVEVVNRTLYHLKDPATGSSENTSAYCLTIRSLLRRNEEGRMEQTSELSWKKVV